MEVEVPQQVQQMKKSAEDEIDMEEIIREVDRYMEDPEISDEEIERQRDVAAAQHPAANVQAQQNAPPEQAPAQPQPAASNQGNGQQAQNQANAARPAAQPPQPPNAGSQNGNEAAELARLKTLLLAATDKGSLSNALTAIRRSPIYRSKFNSQWTEQEMLDASVIDLMILKTGELPDPLHTFICEDCGKSFSKLAKFGSHCMSAHGLQAPRVRDKGTGLKALVKCCGYHPQWINNTSNGAEDWIYKCPCIVCTKGEGSRLITNNGDTMYGHWRSSGNSTY